MDRERQRTLRRLLSMLGGLRPQDREGLGAAASVLEEIWTALPEEAGALREALQLCQEGLQAVLAETHPEPTRLLAAAVAALAACAQCNQQAQEGPALAPALHALRQALGKGQEEPVPSLDELLALFVQLEPDNTADVPALVAALRAFLATPAATPALRQPLQQALAYLEAVRDGTATEVAAALTAAGQLLAAAAEARDAAPAAREDVPERPPQTAAAGAVSGMALLPPGAEIELIGDFLVECREYIEQAEAALLALETDPEDPEALNTVFRAFHTIKGTAAFLGLQLVSELAHRAETLLSRMRDGEIRCTGGYADLALQAVDMLKALAQALQSALAGASASLPAGLEALLDLLAHPEAAGISEEETSPPPSLPDLVPRAGEQKTRAVPRLGDILVAQQKVPRETVEQAVAQQGQEPLGVTLTRSGAAQLCDVAHALRLQRRLLQDGQQSATVRVRTDRLDRLIDMVGELVIAHSMVAQDHVVIHGKHHELLKKVAHVGKIVRELQDLSMAMRMVPLKSTFQKMARVARDVATRQGKAVQFVTEGEETEIDRTMVDVLNDPLVHMVRNAVDHGLEPPEERQRLGKPRTGTVRLAAYHAGSSVVVELQDDGRGLCREKILEKALARGLIASAQGLADHEVFSLIFAPGFSTAERVTEVSGRGVGMDVVKRHIEALRGRIDIASEPGRGTTFTIRLPLTLAITDGMLVRIGTQRYILPTMSIAVSFRPEPSALRTVVGQGELVLLRGELLPLLRLHRLFAIPEAEPDPTRGLLVVIQVHERRYALLVDELLGQQQVVAKSLRASLGEVPGIAGAAILGDGRVGLILDPAGLVALARERLPAETARMTPPAA
ncbi:MAG: hypothetical protein KatS3mg131_1240 [Candidatus Tectimicrobiota bacterium]|nr:MAG: hypothetical protein KatS3mg131_1240 [Candidatus Tectomicrobia bacterium]